MNMKERLSDLARIIKSQFGASTNCRSQGKNCRSVAIPNVLPRPDFVGIAGQLSESGTSEVMGPSSAMRPLGTAPPCSTPTSIAKSQAGTIGAGLTSRDYFAQYFQTL